jgi:hypothetical protein
VGAELFHTEVRTDRLTHGEAVTFRSLANATKFISGFACCFDWGLLSRLTESDGHANRTRYALILYLCLRVGRKSSALVRHGL